MIEPEAPSPVEKDAQEYPIKAFLDANIILECKPLEDLPWEEIDPDGPILALLTAQAIQEVDSKKRDGRLQAIARSFNRKISPLATGGGPLVIREASPRVELALAKPGRIPWDDYDELDPQDGDARIVAEALHARDIEHDQKVIVSHDIKPIAYATGRDLRAVHVSDSWLRPPEPSPHDRRMQQLKQQVKELQSTEPELEIELAYSGDQPVKLYKIAELTSEEREKLVSTINGINPRPARPNGFSLHLSALDDPSYYHRWDEYLDKTIPAFAKDFSAKMEAMFNQRRFRLTVKNTGTIRADRLVVELKTSEGWINDRWKFALPTGPKPPRERSFLDHMPNIHSHIRPRVGRHEIEYVEGPDYARRVVVNCEDFRHGDSWTLEGILFLEASSLASVNVTARVTAANLHGSPSSSLTLEKSVESVHASSLIDMDELKVIGPLPMRTEIDAALELDNFSQFDWNGSEVKY